MYVSFLPPFWRFDTEKPADWTGDRIRGARFALQWRAAGAAGAQSIGVGWRHTMYVCMYV